VSIASLPVRGAVAMEDGAMPAGRKPGRDAGPGESKARSCRPGADSIRYSLVLVSEDGSQAHILKSTL
jgi:hypothetical protein